MIGHTALVTGSTSGIGLAIAAALAEAGSDVMLNGLSDAAAAERTRAELAERTGRAIHFHGADMTQPGEIAALFGAAEAAMGQVDIVVNNAGIQHVCAVEDFPPEMWDRIIAINLSATFHLTRAAVPGMKRRGAGRIINIASVHGLIASPLKSPYVASKHGVVGFTRSVALELAQTGVTANAICPAYVLTPLVAGQVPDLARARGMTEEQVMRDVLLAAQPTKRFVEAGDIGALVVFLCGAAASAITGAAISMDGGWTAQ